MCQATVGKVIEINEGKGSITIKYKGKRMELNPKLVKVKKGDYVLFAAGIAIEKTSKEEAAIINGGIK
jgi:hydrogenase maturation factor